jgi:hypothetical protein
LSRTAQLCTVATTPLQPHHRTSWRSPLPYLSPRRTIYGEEYLRFF